MIVLDVGAGEEFRDIQSPLSSLPAFSAVTIASTPGAALAALRSMRDAALGNGRADD